MKKLKAYKDSNNVQSPSFKMEESYFVITVYRATVPEELFALTHEEQNNPDFSLSFNLYPCVLRVGPVGVGGYFTTSTRCGSDGSSIYHPYIPGSIPDLLRKIILSLMISSTLPLQPFTINVYFRCMTIEWMNIAIWSSGLPNINTVWEPGCAAHLSIPYTVSHLNAERSRGGLKMDENQCAYQV